MGRNSLASERVDTCPGDLTGPQTPACKHQRTGFSEQQRPTEKGVLSTANLRPILHKLSRSSCSGHRAAVRRESSKNRLGPEAEGGPPCIRVLECSRPLSPASFPQWHSFLLVFPELNAPSPEQSGLSSVKVTEWRRDHSPKTPSGSNSEGRGRKENQFFGGFLE